MIDAVWLLESKAVLSDPEVLNLLPGVMVTSLLWVLVVPGSTVTVLETPSLCWSVVVSLSSTMDHAR